MYFSFVKNESFWAVFSQNDKIALKRCCSPIFQKPSFRKNFSFVETFGVKIVLNGKFLKNCQPSFASELCSNLKNKR